MTKSFAVIAFTRPVDLIKDNISILLSNDKSTDKQWLSITSNKSDTIWILRGEFDICDQVTVTMKQNEKEFILETVKINDNSLVGCKIPSFGYEFGVAVKEELKNQLDSCNQLLEFEPNSKWTLLTAALLMRSLDRFQYHEKTLEFLRKLQLVDPLRKGYYMDLASKWILEIKLKDWIESGQYDKIDLSCLDLTTIYYNQFLLIALEVDLHNNPLLNHKSCKFSLVESCNVIF